MTDNLRQMPSAAILAKPPHGLLTGRIQDVIRAAGGWIGFDAFMALALYAPGLGYYANDSVKFGTMPAGANGEGSDFVTAPEMTPLFGRSLAAQVAQALAETGTDQIWEFGAGTGALARDVLEALDRQNVRWQRYTIVELSGVLRARQQEKLSAFGDRICWVDHLPAAMRGVVVGNEVLDAMPVKLLARHSGSAPGAWFERGVALNQVSNEEEPRRATFYWEERPTALRPPCEIEGLHAYVTEIHPQGEAFIRTLADHMEFGAAFFIDYGFPEPEYYHAQRHMGTLMCHRAHRADGSPLADVGFKDITAHVNFTGTAVAAQDAGFEVLGYCTQARFLMNCGLLNHLEDASFADKAMAQKLIAEHEMGELFKVIGLVKPHPDAGASKNWQALGFAHGDRTHTL